MSALLNERTKRQKHARSTEAEKIEHKSSGGQDLDSLVESVRRKSSTGQENAAKRRRT
jgi:hypothetical protein